MRHATAASLRAPRNSMVLVVAQHNLAKPCTDLGRAMMPPTLKLGLDGFEPRGHPPLRSNPPDDESSVAVALPTVVSETQEREGLRFSSEPFPRQIRGRPQPLSTLPRIA